MVAGQDTLAGNGAGASHGVGGGDGSQAAAVDRQRAGGEVQLQDTLNGHGLQQAVVLAHKVAQRKVARRRAQLGQEDRVVKAHGRHMAHALLDKLFHRLVSINLVAGGRANNRASHDGACKRGGRVFKARGEKEGGGERREDKRESKARCKIVRRKKR